MRNAAMGDPTATITSKTVIFLQGLAKGGEEGKKETRRTSAEGARNIPISELHQPLRWALAGTP
jgi:hypothetical protein